MSETPQLMVPTAFADISQLAEGMSDRVDDERLMLYGPGPVDENSWVRFAVLLIDQSVALEGVGRAVASIDGGDERPEVARFDIVLDNLQLEGMSEVVYERMLAYRTSAFTEGPATGEVSMDQVEEAEAALAADVEDVGELIEEDSTVVSGEEYAEQVHATADEPAFSDPADDGYAADDDVVPDAYEAASTESEKFAEVNTADLEAPAEDWDTNEIDIEDVSDVVLEAAPPSAPLAAPPSEPPGFVLEAANGALTRPSRGATWTPNLALAPEQRAPSGLFPYAGGLPIPEQAPRPDLDPSDRIRLAPRPGEASGDRTDQQSVGAGSLDHEADSDGDAGGFDDMATDVVAEDEPVYDEAHAEGYEDAE